MDSDLEGKLQIWILKFIPQIWFHRGGCSSNSNANSEIVWMAACDLCSEENKIL